MNNALLGTDTLSEIGKGINPAVVSNSTAYHQAFGRCTTSAVGVMEIVRGFQRTGSTRCLQTFVASVAALEILPFDWPAAELAGRIAGDLERAGQPIGVADPMIAAIARTQGLELVTGNTAHFRRIQNSATHSRWSNWR